VYTGISRLRVYSGYVERACRGQYRMCTWGYRDCTVDMVRWCVGGEYSMGTRGYRVCMYSGYGEVVSGRVQEVYTGIQRLCVQWIW